LFGRPRNDAAEDGWETVTEESRYRIQNRELHLTSESEADAIIVKGSPASSYEFSANLRLVETCGEQYCFGFLLLDDKSRVIHRFSIDVKANELDMTMGEFRSSVPLPESFNAQNYHQFRFQKKGENLILRLEEHILCDGEVPIGKTNIALFCRNSTAAFDMVRYTILMKNCPNEA
jgi:hypothetical protein